MGKLIVIGVFVWYAVFVCGAGDPALAEEAAASIETGTLRVHMTGIETLEGKVVIKVADSKENYDSETEAFRHALLPASSNEVTAVFQDVPYGEYAVKAFHDENENSKIDIGWRGPTEAYGFSNNVTGLFGPPDYEDARFSFASEDQTIEINAK
jgi:uncharacterized protein (DUF2141 family)